jgi:predicted outer membrane protein
MSKVFLLVRVLAAAAAVASCASPQPQPPVSALSLTSGAVPSAPLDDASIASIAITICDGQAARARVAKTDGRDPGVVALASRIIDEAPASTIRTMNLAPRSSVLQEEVANSTNGDLSYLSTTHGMSFDRAFVGEEKESLASAIELLDETLIPAAVNVELKQSLNQMRDTLASELHDARYLSATLPAVPNAAGLP